MATNLYTVDVVIPGPAGPAGPPGPAGSLVAHTHEQSDVIDLINDLNSKETPGGAQDKADAALEAATGRAVAFALVLGG